ncbi:NACHT, LRR and PYD domains-containing protein 1 homolog [Channa argus]|uniref:NACHT, LRR and PYD domains-containing protein 1 homolog n=1 Tax=Channa argus TaxID=215402 RepID=UPI003522D8B7
MVCTDPEKITSENKTPAVLIHKVATMAAVKQLLLETLNGVSEEKLRIFNRFLQSSSQKVFVLRQTADRAEVVDLIMKAYGQQSVEVTKKIFMKMSRTDLVEQFSGTSSGLKEKNFWCEPESAQFERVPASHDVKQILWETLDTLSYKELRRFMWSLQFMHFKKSIPHKSVYQQKRVHMTQQLVNLMMEKHGQQSVEAVKEILKDMNRTDLVERLSKTSSGRTGRGAELDSRHRGERAFSRDPSDKDPSDWTKLDPEVNSTHTDEAPTYSLQSEVGNFECSVSGLRWSCKVKVSFKYQFCSWEEHMERMENMQYMPAGPLIDITVIVGKLAIVYLPHWICIDDDPRILDKFAVLHIDDCGDVVEKVSEVTSSHVKLSEPVFSPRAVLMKVGFPVKISCNVLIYYKPNTSFLKLHVYLIPHDPALKQTVDKNEFSQGYEIIRKLRPDKHLKMQHGFMLTADIDTAKIQPEKITLRYESQHPNFYEVYIKNPDGNLCITLSYSPRNKGEPKCEHVWTCEIQKDDYSTCAPLGEEDGHCSAVNQKATTTKQSSSGLTAKDFVDKHKVELIKRVSNIAAILDELLYKDVIQQEVYDHIRAIRTPQDKMRELFSGPLKASVACKDAFYKILEKNEPYLIKDLKENN